MGMESEMKHFIAARDDLLFGAKPVHSRLVPYQAGMPCFHWEAVIHSPDDEREVLAVIRAEKPSRHQAQRSST